MSRKTETIDRKSWNAMLDTLDGDVQQQLINDLDEWDDGDTCEMIEVSTDSRGNLDSMSSPRPATESV